MDTEVSLMDYAIQKKNNAFGSLDEKEREKRILTLLNFGFVWNPYYEEFENRFLKITSTAEIANLTSSQMREQVRLLNKNPKSFDVVRNEIYWDSSNRVLARINQWTSTSSIIFGPIIWILGLISVAFSDTFLIGSLLLVIGTALIHYWVTYHMMFLKIATPAELSPLMYKYGGLLRLLRIGSIAATLYLTATRLANPHNFIFVGLGVVFVLLANYGVSKSLASQWWCFNGFPLLEKYYNKHS